MICNTQTEFSNVSQANGRLENVLIVFRLCYSEHISTRIVRPLYNKYIAIFPFFFTCLAIVLKKSISLEYIGCEVENIRKASKEFRTYLYDVSLGLLRRPGGLSQIHENASLYVTASCWSKLHSLRLCIFITLFYVFL